MNVKIGVFIQDLTFRTANRSLGFGKHNSGSEEMSLAIKFVNDSQRMNFLAVLPTILLQERLYFSKTFYGCKSLADVLGLLKDEIFTVTLIKKNGSNYFREESVGRFEDNAFNVLYPYGSLNASYDRLSRRILLNSPQFGKDAILLRMVLSMEISSLSVNPSNFGENSHQEKRNVISSKRRSVIPRNPGSPSSPNYAKPTFSSMMAEKATKRRFHWPANTSPVIKPMLNRRRSCT